MLLSIFSTLAQPLFDDNANATDSQVVNVNYIRSTTDNEPILDTFVAALGKSFSDTVNETDNSVLNTSKVLSDNATPIDTTALALSVSFTDGAAILDTVSLSRSIIAVDGLGSTDTTSKSRSIIFTDSQPILDNIALNRSVLFIENGPYPNSIVFGGPLGFGTFIFGNSNPLGFVRDSALASREYTFNDNAKPTDSVKTVKRLPHIKIEVAEAELRWDIG